MLWRNQIATILIMLTLVYASYLSSTGCTHHDWNDTEKISKLQHCELFLERGGAALCSRAPAVIAWRHSPRLFPWHSRAGQAVQWDSWEEAQARALGENRAEEQHRGR